MTDWQQRVIDEKRELDAKIEKLRRFIFHGKINTVEVWSEAFEALDHLDRCLLQDQLNYMTKYSKVLTERIERFT